MRTTLDLPEALVEKAKKASRAKTKTEAIILGLKEPSDRQKSSTRNT